MSDIILSDPQLGEIRFHRNNLAKRYIIRMTWQSIKVTIPYGGTYKYAENFFFLNRKNIIKRVEKLKDYHANHPDEKTDNMPEYDAEDLRRKARDFLPPLLKKLADSYGFTYKTVTIRNNKKRWGSCSSKGVINLSLSLMLLPQHLIEYVLLHELCHTVHMNHSHKFWELLDTCTGGNSLALRQELKFFFKKNKE